VLSYMCRVGKSRHDLIPRELIIFLDLFDLIARGESPEHGCDSDYSSIHSAGLGVRLYAGCRTRPCRLAA